MISFLSKMHDETYDGIYDGTFLRQYLTRFSHAKIIHHMSDNEVLHVNFVFFVAVQS